MKRIIVLNIFLCLSYLSKAQDFYFQMFFEDAIGNIDTLTIGYDINGTELIDPSLGEENIIGIPLDSIFDVRISDGFFNNGNATFHTRKQMLPNSCSEFWFPVVSIDIKSKNWPVTARWDNSLFYNECREGSLFTCFHPGGWWDVLGHASDLDRIKLIDDNQVTFTPNYNPSTGSYPGYGYVDPSNDTISVFWMTFGSLALIESGVESVKFEVNSYPNPLTDYYYVDMSADLIKEVRIVDITGASKMIDFKNGYLDLRNFEDGFYIIVVKRKDGKIMKRKIIKQ